MSSWSETERLVRERAASRCEYCRMHQSLQGATFHIEHIIPSAKGGPSTFDNLALACPSCNLRKSDLTEALDPQSGQLVSLFHPRKDTWAENFEWDEFRVAGLTAVGRATIATLDFNHERRLRIRDAERLFDLFPPEETS